MDFNRQIHFHCTLNSPTTSKQLRLGSKLPLSHLHTRLCIYIKQFFSRCLVWLQYLISYSMKDTNLQMFE
jgi:hypothetical protein